MLGASVQLYKNAYSGLSKPVWWLSLVIFINRSGTMVILLLGLCLVQRGYTEAQGGYMVGIFGIGAILGAFIGGRLTDRIGHFKVQFLSLFINGVLLIVLCYMQTLLQIGVCIFVLSTIGESFRPANTAAIAAYSTETSRTRSYSLNRLAINLGFIVAPAMGGWLSEISWELLFWVDGISCILAALVLYLVFAGDASRQSSQKEKPKGPDKNSAYKDNTFLYAMFCLFLVLVCFFQMTSLLPIFYAKEALLANSTIGLVLALNGFLIVVCEMVLVYKLENRRNAVFYLAVGAVLIGMSFLMLELSQSLAMIICGMIVITFGEMLLFPFMNNFWVKRCNENNRGQYAAVFTMSFSLAIVVAPTFSSQIVMRFGFEILWMVNFFICAMAAFGFYLMQKQMNHE